MNEDENNTMERCANCGGTYLEDNLISGLCPVCFAYIKDLHKTERKYEREAQEQKDNNDTE